jgi:hypothetical protein
VKVGCQCGLSISNGQAVSVDAPLTVGDRVEVRGHGSSTEKWFPGVIHQVNTSYCYAAGVYYSIQMDSGPMIHSVYPWQVRLAANAEAR